MDLVYILDKLALYNSHDVNFEHIPRKRLRVAICNTVELSLLILDPLGEHNTPNSIPHLTQFLRKLKHGVYTSLAD